MAVGIEVFLAGRVALATTGREPAEIALGCRGRVAVGFLVVERWRPVPANELADAVWGGELPATWGAALRGVIARVRAALTATGADGAQVLTSGPAGYQIVLPEGSTVDIELAEVSLQRAVERIGSDPGGACTAAQAAVHVLRGDFLAGAEGPWVERRQAELAELHLRAIEVLSTAATACGDPDQALWAAEEAVNRQPLRESAHLCAMAAHEAAGNRAAALRAYERCRRTLAEELGIAPGPETERAYVALLGEEPAQVAATGNLPLLLTRFIGRQRERAQVGALLDTSRLVTLTGPGGVGKSRLALESAGDVTGSCPDGVWLIELAGLADPALLPDQVMSALGVADTAGATATESLVAHLATTQPLLVLDNCEHVVAACASLVDGLLKANAGVRVLATSREPLCVSGETVVTVAPLAVPPDGEAATLGSLLHHDAVALFVDRARAASPELDLDASAAAVATVCRRVDGIPLAIELAAARVRSLTVPEIARRLTDRIDLLAGGPRTAPTRHQTLGAALDWSYEGLSDSECRLFVAVSVFSGSFTADAADDVCVARHPGDGPAVDILCRLVDKSLVVADRSGPTTRYRLLETIRRYGQEKLTAAGAEVSVRHALLERAAVLAEDAEGGLDGPHQPAWLRVLDAEHDNLRGALDWDASAGTIDGPRTAAALWRYWEIRGLLGEGRARIEAMMHAGAPASLQAKLSNSAGVLAQGQGHLAAARRLYQQALDLRLGADDQLGVVAALNGLGNVAVGEGDLFAARTIFEQNLAASRELGDTRVIAGSLMNLGVVVQLLFVTGRTCPHEGAVQAHALYSESLRMYRDLGDTRGVAQSLENLGAVAPYQGDDAAAQAFLEESLALRRRLRDKSGIAASARFLGHLALKDRRFGAARSFHQECLAIESELGNQLLMVADLASLAEIAEGEHDHAEADRLIEGALALSDELGDTESTSSLRVRLQALAAGAGRR